MVEALFASGTLNLIYAAVLLVSFIFAVLTLVGAEIGDLFDFALDADTDLDFISISPLALSVFGATFGLVGLITRVWLDLSSVPSVLWATGSGLVFGGVAQAFFIYVLSPTKSSHYSLESDAIGREAEVIVSIPGDGIGQVAFNNVSGRVQLGARSATGQAIASGQVVKIERVVGRIAFVQPGDSQ